MRGPFFISAALVLCVSSAAAADIAPICADRPGKGTGTCTVAAGHVQVETGLIDWAHDRTGGAKVDLTTLGATLLKFGLSDRADVELGVTPLEIFRVHGEGMHEKHNSFGDTLVRVKYRLTSGDAPVQVTLDPFVKLPTANRQLGNRKVEAGLTLPVGVTLGKSPLSLALTSELDWRADLDGHGHHAAMSEAVGLGLAASSRLTLSAELWGQREWDPAVTLKQVSADGSVAYLAGDSVQLDAGANFGLNRQTPDMELYAGVSKRF
jgi:hypothetical protein